MFKTLEETDNMEEWVGGWVGGGVLSEENESSGGTSPGFRAFER